MNDHLKKIILFLLLLAGQELMAQVRFSASLSPAQISRDEYAQLKLSVENAREVRDIVAPVLNDFIIVSGPNQESGMSMINGDVKKYVAINFIIKPKRPGNFTIPSTTAVADGATYRSKPVVLKVSNTSSGNNSGGNRALSPFHVIDPFAEAPPKALYADYILKKGENALDKVKKNIFVRLETDKTSCFVGEPIIASYKLYTRLKSESNMTKNPSFNGFSVIDLQRPDNPDYKREKLNGREYNVYTIRKVQLYPLQAGNLPLEAAEIDNLVHFIKAEYANRQLDLMGDMFRDFADETIPPEGIEDHQVTLQSNPLSILVKPLPDANKPASFKSAVGNFRINAALEKNKFTTDDAGKLTVMISGDGNLQLITAPEITWPEGIEGFDPKLTDDLDKTTVPVSGKKIIEFPFTIASAGTYTIPPVKFSFFDPKVGRYKTEESKPLVFAVTKGTGKRKQVEIKDDPKKDSLLNKFFSSRLRVVSMFAILIIFGLIFWLKTDRKKEQQAEAALLAEENRLKTTEEPVEEILQGQQNPLAAAEESLQRNEGAVFYTVLNQSLKNYLSQKLNLHAEELNKKTISEQLDKKGISNTTSLQLHLLMDEIEWQLYTPFAENEKMQDMYERANDLVQLINTYKV